MKPFYVYKVLSRTDDIPHSANQEFFEYVDGTIKEEGSVNFVKTYEKEWFDTVEEAYNYIREQLCLFSPTAILKRYGKGWVSYSEFKEEIGGPTAKILAFHSNIEGKLNEQGNRNNQS
jgi:hypothetical protein